MTITGKRKLIVALAVIVGASMLVWFGKISGDNWQAAIIWVCGLFFGANSLPAVVPKLAGSKLEIRAEKE